MAEHSVLSLRRIPLPWVPLVAGPLALFGPALIRGQALFWGAPLLQFTPWRVAAKQIVLSGHFPLWNPWVGLGAPLLANYQSALLYPPNWILLLTDVAWGQTLLVMLHLIWAGVGTALLARRLGLGPFAQAIAGLAFGMSGYLVGRSGFLSINAAASWLPWVLLAADRALERPKLSRIAPLALALGLQWLAGHAQTAAYTWVCCAAWVGFRSWMQAGPSGVRRAASILGTASILAFGIAAVQLLPTLEYLRHSERSAGLDPEFALNYSFWPWRLLGLVAPDLFGNPGAGNYWGYGNYWEDHLYLGTLPILLAGGALFTRIPGPLKWFLLGMAAIAFLFALGKNTPVFPWLFRNLPGFGLFQAPTRWNLLTTLALALLAGLGADAWRVASGRRLYWLRLGTAGCAAAFVAAAAGGRLLAGLQPTLAPAAQLGAVGLLVSALLGLTRQDPPRSAWQVGAMGFVVVDLIIASRGLNPTLPASSLEPASSLQTRVGSEHRIYMSADLEQRLKFELAFRFDTFHPDLDWGQLREFGLPNTAILEGVRSANNFDPILPARYAAWLRQLEGLPAPDLGRALRQADVGWRAVMAGGVVEYSEVDSPVRAWVVPDATPASSAADALLRSTRPEFDPSRTVVLEGASPGIGVGGPGEVVSLVEAGPNLIEVTATTPEGGWLVLADSWYPGWLVRIDREPGELQIANGFARATWLPPGEHRVEFTYRPASLLIGLAISLLAWPALAAIYRLR